MKTIAAIIADLEHAPLGHRSRLAAPLCGTAVLRRTVVRALRARSPVGVFVLAPPSQMGAVRDLLTGLDARLETFEAPPPPSAALARAGRHWGLDGWRGGIGGLCAFDEDAHPLILAALAKREAAAYVACIPAHAALIAPDLIDGMIAHHESLQGVFRLCFTPAPPGLAPAIFNVGLLSELAAAGETPGSLLAYSPHHPGPDLLGRDCCYRPAAIIGEARGRLTADTQRSFSRVESLIAVGADDWSAAQVAQALHDAEQSSVLAMPEEIEIELTTEDPSGDGALLRPRGVCVGRRGPIALDCVRRIAESLSLADDVRVVLGGFGEPMLHPQLMEIVRILRDGGAMAIAIRTSGLAGDEALDEALFALPIDVLCVALDAAMPETYRRVWGIDGFERVTARIERWTRWREERRAVKPIIVPELVKAEQTLADMEAFFDHWTGRLGVASISGYSHRAGQRDDHVVTRTAPPRRAACRRLWARMLILADGRVVACDQDFAGRAALGQIAEHSVHELWSGPAFAELRAAHQAARFDVHPLCPQCDEWHRP